AGLRHPLPRRRARREGGRGRGSGGERLGGGRRRWGGGGRGGGGGGRGGRRTWRRTRAAWRRRREVFGRRQEHELVRFRRLRLGRRRMRLRLSGLRLCGLRFWSFRRRPLLGWRRLRWRPLWFRLLRLRPKRSIGDRVVGAIVLPRHERALLAAWAERFFAQQLVKWQHRRGPGLVRAGPKKTGDGLAVRVAPQHEGDLPRLREVVLVCFDVVRRHRDRQRRMGVVPTDQVT